MSSICRENRHLKKSKPTNAGLQFLSLWVTSVPRPRQENLLRLGQRGISSCWPNGWRCRLAIALHSGTAAQSIHATSKTDSIKFVSHKLLSDSIMYNPDLGGHHWHCSWGFSHIFSEWYPIDTPAFCKVSAFFEKSHQKLGGRLGDWWFIEKLGRNPRSKPIPGHLAERSTDPSWQQPRYLYVGFQVDFHCWGLLCHGLQRLQCLQERSEYKLLSILTSNVKRHEMLGFIV